jgi:hypothetical protein
MVGGATFLHQTSGCAVTDETRRLHQLPGKATLFGGGVKLAKRRRTSMSLNPIRGLLPPPAEITSFR